MHVSSAWHWWKKEGFQLPKPLDLIPIFQWKKQWGRRAVALWARGIGRCGLAVARLGLPLRLEAVWLQAPLRLWGISLGSAQRIWGKSTPKWAFRRLTPLLVIYTTSSSNMALSPSPILGFRLRFSPFLWNYNSYVSYNIYLCVRVWMWPFPLGHFHF